MSEIYIYALKDPITQQIKYVGKSKSIRRRLQSHIDYARKTDRKRRYVSDWILSLLRKNLRPEISILEITTEKLWCDREKYWIKHFKELGCSLCNLTDGGKSNNGYKYTKELKDVRRQARIGYRTPESVKKKISRSLSKKVKCVEDNVTFNSMKEAAIYSGASNSTFHRKLHKKQLINGKTYEYTKQ